MATQTSRVTSTKVISCRQAGDRDTFRVIVAANAEARDNYIVDLASLRLENYRKDPVVLWAHSRSSLPVGRTHEISVNGLGQIEATFSFASHQFAQDVKTAWQEDFLRAASIAWGGGFVTPGGYQFTSR